MKVRGRAAREFSSFACRLGVKWKHCGKLSRHLRSFAEGCSNHKHRGMLLQTSEWRLRHGSARLGRWVLLALASVAISLIASEIFAADGTPFTPARKLTSWYTDRNPIDIEVVATSGIGPDARFLQPRRTLRLRLERAYVHLILWREQPPYDYSSAGLSFDSITGLPTVLFQAPPEQVDKRGDDIPQLGHDKMVRRTLNLIIDGHWSAEQLRMNSANLDRCRGVQERDGLFRFKDDGSAYCHIGASLGETSYVAVLSPDLSSRITCTDQAIGCSMTFPYGDFAPKVSFHRDHLDGWRTVLDRVRDFLDAKKYQ
jgi:hypothetical protein